MENKLDNNKNSTDEIPDFKLNLDIEKANENFFNAIEKALS